MLLRKVFVLRPKLERNVQNDRLKNDANGIIEHQNVFNDRKPF
jgi:hypothetical protein